MKIISIIGAGPAGLMTAASILLTPIPSPEGEGGFSGTNFQIHIFEKNPSPGKKLLLSGGGRCNVTTGIIDKKILATKYTRGWDFIERAMSKFSPKKCREWFEDHDVRLKCESDMRVFPVSDDGYEILEVFENLFAKHSDRVILHYGEGVSDVSINPLEKWGKIANPLCKGGQGGFCCGDLGGLENSKDSHPPCPPSQKGVVKQFLITTAKQQYETDILVITTGGNAYAHTGSNGDGYNFAKTLGHTITPLGPSLSSFLISEEWIKECSGIVFENARISFVLDTPVRATGSRHSGRSSAKLELKGGLVSENQNKTPLPSFASLAAKSRTRETFSGGLSENINGSLLLTHFGISGPLAFMLSSHLAWEKVDSQNKKTILFAPLSSMRFADWDIFLKNEFQKHPKKILISILSEQLPRRFAEAFVQEYFPHIIDTFASSISRVEREKISKLLGDGICLTLTERRPGDEFVTAGGVDTEQIDTDSMESRIQKNLYFAGEILNVDGYTGGFSLQICWASGYMAGRVIGESIR